MFFAVFSLVVNSRLSRNFRNPLRSSTNRERAKSRGGSQRGHDTLETIALMISGYLVLLLPRVCYNTLPTPPQSVASNRCDRADHPFTRDTPRFRRKTSFRHTRSLLQHNDLLVLSAILLSVLPQ